MYNLLQTKNFPCGRKEGIWGIGMEWNAVVEPSLFLDKVDCHLVLMSTLKRHKNGLPSLYISKKYFYIT